MDEHRPMSKRMRNEGTAGHCSDAASSQDVGRLPDVANPTSSLTNDSFYRDNGHRYGNFHNYYNFNPATNRTSYMHGIFDFIATEWNQKITNSATHSIFRYLDVGCNEGDLTIEVAKLLSSRLTHSKSCSAVVESKNSAEKTRIIHITGMDLDEELIQRAQAKFQQQMNLHSSIQAEFQVVDVLEDGIAARSCDDVSSTLDSQYRADLTSLFSTTMWLHIHGGDEGLRRVLGQICSSTRYWILLESQPSKCYATAAFRLRRMGMEPLDVSNQRLQLRSSVEEAIELIMRENSFERVTLIGKSQAEDRSQNASTTTNNEEPVEVKETKTPWNRSLRLYVRVNHSSRSG